MKRGKQNNQGATHKHNPLADHEEEGDFTPKNQAPESMATPIVEDRKLKPEPKEEAKTALRSTMNRQNSKKSNLSISAASNVLKASMKFKNLKMKASARKVDNGFSLTPSKSKEAITPPKLTNETRTAGEEEHVTRSEILELKENQKNILKQLETIQSQVVARLQEKESRTVVAQVGGQLSFDQNQAMQYQQQQQQPAPPSRSPQMASQLLPSQLPSQMTPDSQQNPQYQQLMAQQAQNQMAQPPVSQFDNQDLGYQPIQITNQAQQNRAPSHPPTHQPQMFKVAHSSSHPALLDPMGRAQNSTSSGSPLSNLASSGGGQYLFSMQKQNRQLAQSALEPYGQGMNDFVRASSQEKILASNGPLGQQQHQPQSSLSQLFDCIKGLQNQISSLQQQMSTSEQDRHKQSKPMVRDYQIKTNDHSGKKTRNKSLGRAANRSVSPNDESLLPPVRVNRRSQKRYQTASPSMPTYMQPKGMQAVLRSEQSYLQKMSMNSPPKFKSLKRIKANQIMKQVRSRPMLDQSEYSRPVVPRQQQSLPYIKKVAKPPLRAPLHKKVASQDDGFSNIQVINEPELQQPTAQMPSKMPVTDLSISQPNYGFTETASQNMNKSNFYTPTATPMSKRAPLFGKPPSNNPSRKSVMIQSFLSRNAGSNRQDGGIDSGSTSIKQDPFQEEELFAEKFQKFTVRDFAHNTRMNIKNIDYAAQRVKRERAMNYWQNNVIQNHLPSINEKKKQEMLELKRQTTVFSRGGRRYKADLNASIRSRGSVLYGLQETSLSKPKASHKQNKSQMFTNDSVAFNQDLGQPPKPDYGLSSDLGPSMITSNANSNIKGGSFEPSTFATGIKQTPQAYSKEYSLHNPSAAKTASDEKARPEEAGNPGQFNIVSWNDMEEEAREAQQQQQRIQQQMQKVSRVDPMKPTSSDNISEQLLKTSNQT